MTTHLSPSDPASVAVELERIRRVVEVGFAEQSGALQLLVQRHDQTDRHLVAHDEQLAEHDRRLDTLERGGTDRQHTNDQRLTELEARQIPWRHIAAAVTVLAAILGAVQFLAAQYAGTQ